ncbi:hypothetical protein T484DRAFT_1903103, partial [Baffinella frigidus]
MVELVSPDGGGASVRANGASSRGKRVAVWISGACLVVATVAVCVSQGGGGSLAQAQAETYQSYLGKQAHTVAIREPSSLSGMLRDDNLKVPVECGFGVHCQLHVRPLQIGKTSGAWLGMGRVHGLKELVATKGDPAAVSKGPWAWTADESRDDASLLSSQGKSDWRAAGLLEHRMEEMDHDRSERDYMTTAPTIAGADPWAHGGKPVTPQERIDAQFAQGGRAPAGKEAAPAAATRAQAAEAGENARADALLRGD